MDFLRSLFSRPREPQEPKVFPSSILSKVPLDVLVYIIHYLSPESAVAFSLTCKHFLYSLGTQHFAEMTSSIDKLALLELLAVDLPDQVVCYPCIRLHKFEDFRRYNSSTYDSGNLFRQYDNLRLPTCVTQDRITCTYKISNTFGTTTFKMIMKMYCQQSDYSRLLKTMSGKAKTMEIEYYVLLYTEECRIIQGHLMHRLQRVYLPRRRSDFNRHPPSEMVCPHLLIRLSIQDVETEASRITRCQQCRTEYRIAFKRFESHRLALVVSRWKDLGPGPENKIWAQHIPPKALISLRKALIRRESASAEGQTQVETWSQEEYLSSVFGDDDGGDFIFYLLFTPENSAKLLRLQNRK